MSKLGPRPNQEAEESVCGAILVRPEVLDTVAEIVSADDFQLLHTASIYRVILAIYEKGDPVDLVTVTSHLKAEGSLDIVGGPAYVAGLSEQVGFATNAAYYAKLVKDASLLRQLYAAGREIALATTTKVEDVGALIDAAGGKLFALSESANRGQVQGMHELAVEMEETMAAVRKTGVTGVQTGFVDLDTMLRGLQPKDLIVLAARPSMGKTALALNIATNVSNRDGGVLFFSLEMAAKQLMFRLMASETGIPGDDLRSSMLKASEYVMLEKALGVIERLPLYIDDTPALSTLDVRARARRQMAKTPLNLVVVDYLQLMRSSNPKLQSRNDIVGDISTNLKSLAKELGVPVLALAQLSRACESRRDKRPILSDLRDSGSIEQDADVVAFIYRDEVYNEFSPDKGTAEVLIRKHRNGQVGNIRLAYNGPLTQFSNYTSMREGE